MTTPVRYIDTKELPDEPSVPREVCGPETVFARAIAAELRRLDLVVPQLRRELKETDALATARGLLDEGFAPLLVISGHEVEVIPDVLLALVAADGRSSRMALVIMPLVRHVEQALRIGRGELARRISIFPAPKAWSRDANGRLLEHEVLRYGTEGYTLVHSSDSDDEVDRDLRFRRGVHDRT